MPAPSAARSSSSAAAVSSISGTCRSRPTSRGSVLSRIASRSVSSLGAVLLAATCSALRAARTTCYVRRRHVLDGLAVVVHWIQPVLARRTHRVAQLIDGALHQYHQRTAVGAVHHLRRASRFHAAHAPLPVTLAGRSNASPFCIEKPARSSRRSFRERRPDAPRQTSACPSARAPPHCAAAVESSYAYMRIRKLDRGRRLARWPDTCRSAGW